MRRVMWTCALAGAALLSGAAVGAGERANDEGVAQDKGLTVLSERTVRLPLSGLQLQLSKVLDPRTGESRVRALRDGVSVDHLAALRREEELRWQRYGSLNPELYRKAEERPEEPFQVLVKLNVAEERFDKSDLKTDHELEQAAPEAARLEGDLERRASETFEAVLASVGVFSAKSTVMGPFVQTQLPGRVLTAMARDRRLAFVGLDGEKPVLDYPTVTASLPTTRTNTVHGFGFKGAGVKLAILESGGLNVPAACFNIGGTQAVMAADDHFTKSAGIIGNRYSAGACTGTWTGYAPDATVLLANGSDYTAAYTWAKGQGANVVTMSWHFTSEETSGSLSSRDIFFDYATTHYPYPTVFTSAGNQAASGAFSSGKGYNFFGVADVDNDGDGNRCNDTLASSSTWKDPTSTHGDREVPALASPGSRHDVLASSFGGTSAATPVTASIASVLMSSATGLKFWPEGVRAILLATANYQNADGANFATWLDGKDGAGMTNTYYAYLTGAVRETTTTPQFRGHDYGSMTSSSFTGGFFNKTWTGMTGTTSSRIRVALTWNSKTAGTPEAPTSSVLDADLDLWVYDPDGLLVATSSSWDNNNEFVEFTPAKTGNYTIKIRGFSVPADFFSYYGVAWTTHYDICS